MSKRTIGNRAVLHVGDCLDALRAMPSNSVDSVVTDPPYGLSESFIVNYQEGRAAYGKSPDRFSGE